MVEARVMGGVRAKEEEIEKMGKANWALEERLRSLCVENQIWKDLAHTNEATVHSLQQALVDAAAAAQCHNYPVEQPARNKGEEEEEEEESESSCRGSSSTTMNGEDQIQSQIEIGKQRRKWGRCRKCGDEEAGVVVLPCRHLCLCTACGSTLHACPICHSRTTATIHVNFS